MQKELCPYDNQGGDTIERQIIDIFVDGMNNDQLKIQIPS